MVAPIKQRITKNIVGKATAIIVKALATALFIFLCLLICLKQELRPEPDPLPLLKQSVLLR